MKINKLLIISLVLISMLSLFVVATTQERYALSEWDGSSNEDSYNLRTYSYNEIDSPTDFESCSVGYGTSLGVYPSSVRVDNIRYSYLVVPTSSAFRVVNSDCSEINVISLSGVTFYGTMATIHENAGTLEKHVILGYNSTSGDYGFYAFSFDTDTTQIEFNSYKRIGTGIDEDYFNGVACGFDKKAIADDGKCAIGSSTKLIIWDLSTDSITNVTTSKSLDRPDSAMTPFGAVVDFDNDGNNEFVFATIGGTVANAYTYFMSYDLHSETLDLEKTILVADTSTYRVSYYKADNIIPVMPCQIGGASSEFEICANYYYRSTLPQDRYLNAVYSQDGTSEDYDNWETYKHILTMGTGLYSDLSINKDYIKFVDSDIYVTKSDYSTEIKSFNIPSSSFPTYMNTLLFDVYSDSDKELILSNGEIYSILSGNKIGKLDYLSNSSTGYLVAGDINFDYENEIIYSDSSNIFIYSTNPIATYSIDLSVPVPYAIDEDGGINYIESGYTYVGYTDETGSYNTSVAYDTCSSSNLDAVQEYYIDSNLEVALITYDCTTGGYYSCLAGMCLNQSQYEYIDEGIQNGTIDYISGGQLVTPTESTPTQSDLPSILQLLDDNKQTIFAILFIAGIVVLTAQMGVKEPVVLAFVGILATIIATILGFIDAFVLIMIIVVLALLVVAGMTIFNKRGD